MKNFIIFCVLTLFTVSSSVSILAFESKIGAEWINPTFTDRSFSKIAVIAITKDAESRGAFESIAVKQLRKKRINAVKGSTVFPIISDQKIAPKELIRIIKENKLDGIITMSLVKIIDSVSHMPGRIYSVSSGNRGLGAFWNTSSKTMNEPGQIVFTKSYLIETNLFDLRGDLFEGKQTLVWKGQSTLVSPKSKQSAAEKFTKPMMKHLLKKRIVKRKKNKKTV